MRRFAIATIGAALLLAVAAPALAMSKQLAAMMLGVAQAVQRDGRCPFAIDPAGVFDVVDGAGLLVDDVRLGGQYYSATVAADEWLSNRLKLDHAAACNVAWGALYPTMARRR